MRSRKTVPAPVRAELVALARQLASCRGLVLVGANALAMRREWVPEDAESGKLHRAQIDFDTAQEGLRSVQESLYSLIGGADDDAEARLALASLAAQKERTGSKRPR